MRGIAAIRRGTGRAGLDTGRFGAGLGRYKAPIRVGVLAVAAIGYLSVDHPTGNTALGFVVALVVALFLLELLASEPDADASAEPSAEAPTTS